MSEFDLEFRNVSKTFGDVSAVDDVTLQVRRGEFLSLLGPSGATSIPCSSTMLCFPT